MKNNDNNFHMHLYAFVCVHMEPCVFLCFGSVGSHDTWNKGTQPQLKERADRQKNQPKKNFMSSIWTHVYDQLEPKWDPNGDQIAAIIRPKRVAKNCYPFWPQKCYTEDQLEPKWDPHGDQMAIIIRPKTRLGTFGQSESRKYIGMNFIALCACCAGLGKCLELDIAIAKGNKKMRSPQGRARTGKNTEQK